MKWGKAEKESKGALGGLMKTTSYADTWFNRYTEPAQGFIILRSGERLAGKIVVHHRYNEASKYTAKDQTGKIIPYPGGVDVIADVKLFQGGEATAYKGDSVAAYGATFRIADWVPDKKLAQTADNFNPGTIKLEDGTLRTGMVALATARGSYKDLRYFQMVCFAADPSAEVEIYSGEDAANAVLPKVSEASQDSGGKSIKYLLYRGALIDQAAWIARIESDPKGMDAEPAVPGELALKNESVLKGRFALAAGKKKTWSYFIDENNDLFYISSAVPFKVLQLTVAGQPERYVVLDGRIVRNRETIAELEEDKELHEGRVALLDGKVIEGRVSFKRIYNLIKSYRLPIGVYVVPSGANSLVEEYDADDVDYVEEVDKGKRVKFMPLDGILVSVDDYLKSLEGRKDETRSLQSGFIAFKDGRKLEGRVFRERSAVVFVSKDNKLDRIKAQTEELAYFVMKIAGTERKFIPQQHGIKAFSGPGYDFVEVMEPSGVYSYCVNTKPTHLKKGITNLVKGTMNTVGDVGQVALANEVAKQQIRSDMEAGADVGTAVVSGAQAQKETLEKTQGMVQVGDEGGIYHKEWIVMNNKTGEQLVVFKDNYTDEMKALLAQCISYTSLEKKELRRLTDLDYLGDAVKFLNGCNR